MSKSKKIQRLVFLGISLMLLLALTVGFIPQTAQAAACKFKHKVVPGETLIYIGTLYNTDWQSIADANDLQPPYALQVGQVLCIPEGDAPAATSSSSSSTTGGAKLEVQPSWGSVIVGLENFGKQTVYFINVRPRGQWVQYRIGQMKTNKEGSAQEMFRLADEVKGVQFIELCAKNAWTDEASCIIFENVYYALYKEFLSGCFASGR